MKGRHQCTLYFHLISDDNATYFNRDRDAINAALFEIRCSEVYKALGNLSDTLMIFSDNLKVQNSQKQFVPFSNSAAFWQGCGEDNAKTSPMAGRMDPVLKLYTGCRIMLPYNKDVPNGQAKGTQALLQKVVLKPGVTPTMVELLDGTPVPSVRASQVQEVILEHCNDCINPSAFAIQPQQYTFNAKLPKPRVLQCSTSKWETIRMKANQLPILINNATTGHKLQGSSVDTLFVHNWSKVANWTYVMLSRVRTRQGLHSRRKLNARPEDFAVPQSLTNMLKNFEKKQPTYWSKMDYERMLQQDQQ